MANNAVKFTGKPEAVLMPDLEMDVEQLRADAEEMIDEGNYSDCTNRVMRFLHNHPAEVQRAEVWIHDHPLAAKAAMAGAGLVMLAPGARAEAFGINQTEVDEAFSILNDCILPNVGETISAMPSIVIPLVILIVLIIILLFVPELLYSLIEMVKGALKIKKS